jgi:hypothetical protein
VNSVLSSQKETPSKKVELFAHFVNLAKMGIFVNVATVALNAPSYSLSPVFFSFSEAVKKLTKTVETLEKCKDDVLSSYASAKLKFLKSFFLFFLLIFFFFYFFFLLNDELLI